ncbi:MAG: T9SS type A sorting domain-containing protein [Bacteroidales bacterium]|nr:T9SS type A sorting domain-containing protein [Bacteroidales bacterium]
MKKLYLLLVASVLLCGTTMAQLSNGQFSLKANQRANAVKALKQNVQKADPVWTCDFEGETAWAFGNDTTIGTATWAIATPSTYPSTLGSNGRYYLFPLATPTQGYSETPDHWAYVDLITPLVVAGQEQALAEKPWIEFSNINLSSVAVPKLSFISSMRKLNSTKYFVKVSVDGGATWTDHEFFADLDSNGDHEVTEQYVLIPEAGNSAEVKIRFQCQYDKEGNADTQMGYGWNIDDIAIESAAGSDISIVYGRMGMFGYIDYKGDLSEYWTASDMTPAEKRDYAYQYYDPYGQSPRQQWVTSSGFGTFHVEVKNDGAAAVVPVLNVVVTSPSGTEVYNQTVTGRSIASTVRDTLDLATIDDEDMANSTVFYFNVQSENEIELGRYTITYSVSIQGGAEDPTPANNTLEQYFDISDNNFSKSYYEPTNSSCINCYVSSASGEDEFGTEFMYLYSPEDNMSVDVYIDERTTVGTSICVKLYEQVIENNQANNVLRRTSDYYEITDADLNKWVNLTFTNEYPFSFADGETYRIVYVMVQGSWDNDDDDIYLGASNVLTRVGHNSYMRLGAAIDNQTGEPTWYYGADDVAVTFHAGEGVNPGVVNVEENLAGEISMYPNPSNGIVNFTNVENATIEVYNMMGQVVASESNVSENASIDLSGVANGNYIVRIVKDGVIATSKLNIVK